MKKKRLKKKTKAKLTLRQKRIIRTKEKRLLKKELAAHGVKVSSKKKTKKKITKTASKGGCGGCRRKKKSKG